MRRGPKPLPEQLRIVRGTSRPDRGHNHGLTPQLPVDTPPEWLSPEARELWVTKMTSYAARGLWLGGAEQVLAHYVMLELALVDRWRRGETPPASLLTCYRALANEFFDLPSAQMSAGARPDTSSRFTKNSLGGPPAPDNA
jgi:hypothetical protein